MFASRFKLIGARVAFYRKLKGYTQLDLGQMVNLSEDYISKIETGKALGVSLQACMKLAEALEVTLEDLTKEK